MAAGSCTRARTARGLVAALALALAGCGATGGADRPGADATLLLDGPAAAIHAGIASALARGYDEAEGVHLKVRQGTAGTDGARALLTGRADLAILDLNDLARHRDVVAVMAIAERPLLAFLPPPVPRAALPRRPWARRLEAAIRHPRGARLARWDEAPPARGALHVEDAGVPAYPELVLAVARQRLTDSPSVVRAAVAALARGYRFTLTDPASSAQDLQTRFPGARDVGAQLDRLDGVLLGDGGRPGALDAAQIARWARWARARGLPSAVAVEPRYARAAASADQG